MPKQQDFWDQLNADCKAIAPEVSNITGAAYGFITEAFTENAPLAGAVEQIIGDFVGEHWGDTCDLPQNIAASFDDTQSTAIDSSPSQADGSVSPDM